jgi:hypothetical protein
MCKKTYPSAVDTYIFIESDTQWVELKKKYNLEIEKPRFLIIKKDGTLEYLD